MIGVGDQNVRLAQIPQALARFCEFAMQLPTLLLQPGLALAIARLEGGVLRLFRDWPRGEALGLARVAAAADTWPRVEIVFDEGEHRRARFDRASDASAFFSGARPPTLHQYDAVHGNPMCAEVGQREQRVADAAQAHAGNDDRGARRLRDHGRQRLTGVDRDGGAPGSLDRYFADHGIQLGQQPA